MFGAAFSWVLLEPPAHGDGQCQIRVPSLCQMVPQTWSSPDQTSALLMPPGSSLPGTKPRSMWGRLCACPGSSPSLLIRTVCTCQPDAIAVLLSPPHPRPPSSPATRWGRELALLPEMLPSSHLPAPSNPVEELEALKVSSETRKAEIWGSAGGCWGGV